MKKKYLILVLIAMITLISCVKDEIENKEFGRSQIDQILKMEGQSQKSAYLLLNEELKHQIWMDKLNKIKADFRGKKLVIVEELIAMIEPDFFSTNLPHGSKYDKKTKGVEIKSSRYI